MLFVGGTSFFLASNTYRRALKDGDQDKAKAPRCDQDQEPQVYALHPPVDRQDSIVLEQKRSFGRHDGCVIEHDAEVKFLSSSQRT